MTYISHDQFEDKPMPKMKTRPKKPRTRGGQRYTEAGFWGFIRAGLRRKYNRWGPKYDVLQAARRKNQSSNKRLKWEFQCATCKKWFAQKKVEVNHITPCGSLRCADDLPGFVERLFCEAKHLEVLCKDCHSKETAKSRKKK